MGDNRQGSNISVTGTGKVMVSPDEATVHLTIFTEGETAAEAVAANARQTQAVIDAVSEQPNHGVTTSGLSVYPVVSYEPNASIPRIIGFRATNSVDVTTKVGYVGQIFDAGIAAGANQSSGISFRVQNEAPYREQVLRLAVDAAFQEAQVVASASDLELGEVESIQVEPSDRYILFRTEARDARAPATPVIPERQMITARVQMQFGTRDRQVAQRGRTDQAGRDVQTRSGAA